MLIMKRFFRGNVEIIQWLRVHSALTEDSNSQPHVEQLTTTYNSGSRDQHLLASMGTYIHMHTPLHRYIYN